MEQCALIGHTLITPVLIVSERIRSVAIDAAEQCVEVSADIGESAARAALSATELSLTPTAANYGLPSCGSA